MGGERGEGSDNTEMTSAPSVQRHGAFSRVDASARAFLFLTHEDLERLLTRMLGSRCWGCLVSACDQGVPSARRPACGGALGIGRSRPKHCELRAQGTLWLARPDSVGAYRTLRGLGPCIAACALGWSNRKKCE